MGGGAAGRNGGFLLAGTARFHHDAVAAWGRERAVALYAATLAEMDRLEAELGSPVIRRVGSLRVPGLAGGGGGLRAAARRRWCATGSRPRPPPGPSGPACSCRATARSTRSHAAGLLAARARAAGAHLFAGLARGGARRRPRRDAGGAVRCRAVVVAVDGGLETLLPELAPRVRSTRLQMLATAPVALGRIPRPVYDNWGHDYWQQLPDGRVALGGGRTGSRTRNGDARPSRTPTCRRGSTGSCASAPGSTRP